MITKPLVVDDWSWRLAYSQLYDVFPGLLKYLPGPHQTVHSNYREILIFLNKEIIKHQEELNPDDPRDYIDVYLAEMEKVTYLCIYSKVHISYWEMTL